MNSAASRQLDAADAEIGMPAVCGLRAISATMFSAMGLTAMPQVAAVRAWGPDAGASPCAIGSTPMMS